MSRRDAAHRAVRWETWPVADRQAWDRAISPGDPFNDAGRGASWAAATRRRYQWAWGRWLRFLEHRGELDNAASGIPLVAPARTKAFIALLRSQDLAPLTIASVIESLSNTLYAMAPEPEQDWEWLRRIRNRLKRQARPAKSVASLLMPVEQIFAKGLAVMDAAEADPPRRPLQDSVRFRDGLMLALLAATALRAKNFMALTLGVHLLRSDAGWRLVIPAAEVKNKQPLEGPLPDRLVPYLDRYVRHHRRRLAQGTETDALWVTYQGHAMSANAVNRIVKLTIRHLGRRIHPHLFRHCLATSIATDHPSDVLLIRSLLGHTTLATAERHYNKAQMIDAGRRYAATVEQMRSRLERES